MKKVFSLFLVTLLSLALSACAPTTERKSYRSIKCPACGYQFDAPATN